MDSDDLDEVQGSLRGPIRLLCDGESHFALGQAILWSLDPGHCVSVKLTDEGAEPGELRGDA